MDKCKRYKSIKIMKMSNLLDYVTAMSRFVNRHLRHVKPVELVSPLLHYYFHHSLLFLFFSSFFFFCNLWNGTCIDSVYHVSHELTPLHRLVAINVDLRKKLKSAMKQFVFFIFLRTLDWIHYNVGKDCHI